MGRETFIAPVTWDEDGRPHAAPVLLDGRHESVVRKLGFPSDTAAALDGFDGEIVAVRQYPREVASLDSRPGAARLTGRGVGLDMPSPCF